MGAENLVKVGEKFTDVLNPDAPPKPAGLKYSASGPATEPVTAPPTPALRPDHSTFFSNPDPMAIWLQSESVRAEDKRYFVLLVLTNISCPLFDEPENSPRLKKIAN